MNEQFSDVLDFAQRAARLSRMSELRTLINDTVLSIGFDYFALLHHVDITRSPEGTVRIDNYPSSWSEAFAKKKLFASDPVHVACQKTSAGFLWEDLPSMIRMTDTQKAILEEAGRNGLGEGFTVPIHMPGEFPGSISFAIRRGKAFPKQILPAAHVIGCYAFEAARRITRLEHARRLRSSAKPPALTPRERECVIMSAKGDSDKAIAKTLGLSEVTAHKHIENAKRSYGVRTRPQLAVHALFYGHATFADMMESAADPT